MVAEPLKHQVPTNTAEWKGRPWPPPPPPVPRRLQAQLQAETFRKDTSANQPSQRLTTQHPKAKPSANKRRRRPRDPHTGKYKRSNKRSSKALQKRDLRKRIHRLRKEPLEEQQAGASSSKQENQNKGQVKRKESPDPSSHQAESDTNTSGSETVESDSSSISVVAPAHRRGEPRP